MSLKATKFNSFAHHLGVVSKKRRKEKLPTRPEARRELSVIPRGGAAVGFRDAIAGPARRFVSAW